MIITLLRKPLEGTVAENTLKHGCGALNIDATRIGSGHHLPLGKVTSKKLAGDGGLGAGSGREGERGGFIPRSTEGRWPANFILTHKDGCELKGTKKVKSDGHWTQKANIGKFYEGGWSHQEIDEGNRMAGEDGNEDVADWVCVVNCPVQELDQQSGGASRFFKQFKKDND